MRAKRLVVLAAVFVILSPAVVAHADIIFLPLAYRRSPLTQATLRNGRYELDCCDTFQLTNGHYEEQFDDLPSIRVWFDAADVGDLNGDGAVDAAVILKWNGGGTGTFVYVVAVVGGDTAPFQAAAEFIEDRAVVSSVVVRDGLVALDLVVHAPGDALCCPSLRETRTYRLRGDDLERT